MPPEPNFHGPDEAIGKPKEGCARLLRFTAPEHTGVHKKNEAGYKKVRVDTATVVTIGKSEDLDTKAWFPARTVFDDTTPVRRRIDSDLSFESRFESGNLQRAVRTSEFEYNMTLRADVNTGKAQWFYFLVQRMQRGASYRFNITNFYKDKSMYNMGLQPLVWSTEDSIQNNLGWRRLGTEISYYENGLKQDNGSNYFTLSFKVSFPHTNDNCYVSMCYPYTYTDLQKYLRSLEKHQLYSRNFSRSELCKTLAGNSCDLLQITNGDSHIPIRARKAFVLTSRVHPGESNASYIMKGVLDFLVSNDRVAIALRNQFVFYVVPMLNPDGVINGFYRASLSGDDLNRQWADPSKKHHSTIYSCKQLIKRLVKDERLLLFCDFHGHSTKRNAFMYGCPSVEPCTSLFQKEVFRREVEFPKLLCKRCKHFSYKDCKFETDRGKDNSGRVIIFREFGVIHSFTLEASLFGREVDGNLVHFSQQDFEEIGFEFCFGLAEYAIQTDSWGLSEGAVEELHAALKNENPGPGAAVLDSYLKSLQLIRDKRHVSEQTFEHSEQAQAVENLESEGKENQMFCSTISTVRTDCSSLDSHETPRYECHDQQEVQNDAPTVCLDEVATPDPSEGTSGVECGNLSPKSHIDGMRHVATAAQSGSSSSRDTECKTPIQPRVAKLCTSFTFDVLLRNQGKPNQTASAAEGSPIKQLPARPDINYQMWRSIRNASRRGPTLPMLAKECRTLESDDHEKCFRPSSHETLPRTASANDVMESSTSIRQHSLQTLTPSSQDRLISKADEIFGEWRDANTSSDDLAKVWQNSSRCESPWRGCLPVGNDAINLRSSTAVSTMSAIKRSCIAGCTSQKNSELFSPIPSRTSRAAGEQMESMAVWPYLLDKSEATMHRRAGMSLTHRKKTKDLDRDDIGIQKGVLISFLRKRK